MPKSVRAILLTPLILALLSLRGCGDRHSETTTITVLAAASLTEAMTEIADRYEAEHPGVRVACSFAGSQVLASQLLTGGRADVFCSADATQMDRVKAIVETPSLIARGRLVVITNADASDNALDALASAQRIAIAGPDVPAGRLARQACERLGLWDDVQPKVLSEEESVRGVLLRVALGEADAGFVYATDVGAAPEGTLTAHELPEGAGAGPEYLGAVCKSADDPDTARGFLEYLTSSEEARAVLTAQGFSAP